MHRIEEGITTGSSMPKHARIIKVADPNKRNEEIRSTVAAILFIVF